jgi:5'-3' exoribonuclease 2
LDKCLEEKFDSNTITPGTEFMFEFSQLLQFLIDQKMKSEPRLKDIRLILSDSTVEGEGEHKIMNFIKKQRTHTSYDAHTTHCLFGSDGDLIVLALVTHEPNFYIMKEQPGFIHNNNNKNSQSTFRIDNTVGKGKDSDSLKQKVEFISIQAIRDYLSMKIMRSLPKEMQNLEKVVDDFVFTTLLAGNDFIPTSPYLKIKDGDMDCLINSYVSSSFHRKRHLVDGHIFNHEAIETFLIHIGKEERRLVECPQHLRTKNKMFSRGMEIEDENKTVVEKYCLKAGRLIDKSGISMEEVNYIRKEFNDELVKHRDLREEEKSLETMLSEGIPDYDTPDCIEYGKVRKNYYSTKFGILDEEEEEEREEALVTPITEISRRYFEGLLWIYTYYYGECPSWTWFYPYHYAPFISDLNSTEDISIE